MVRFPREAAFPSLPDHRQNQEAASLITKDELKTHNPGDPGQFSATPSWDSDGKAAHSMRTGSVQKVRVLGSGE